MAAERGADALPGIGHACGHNVIAAAGDDPRKKAAAEAAHKTIALSDLERELIIRFVLKDDRVVFGGEPISGPPEK